MPSKNDRGEDSTDASERHPYRLGLAYARPMYAPVRVSIFTVSPS
jgi:hypothetical protein